MAGHSQFANIKHRKGAQDIKRAQKFTKLKREVIVAAKLGMPDPAFNPRLRAAILAARKENMPKDKIDDAIKSAAGNIADDNYEEVLYEGYGSSGLPLIVHVLTNNRNRTASELRFAFSRYGGNLGESGSVAFLFDHVGFIVYKAGDIFFDDFFNYALELEASDVEEKYEINDDGEQEKYYHVLCDLHDLARIRDALHDHFSDAETVRLYWKAKDPIIVDNQELAEKIVRLIEALEDSDDVQHIDCGFMIAPDVLSKIS